MGPTFWLRAQLRLERLDKRVSGRESGGSYVPGLLDRRNRAKEIARKLIARLTGSARLPAMSRGQREFDADTKVLQHPKVLVKPDHTIPWLMRQVARTSSNRWSKDTGRRGQCRQLTGSLSSSMGTFCQ